MFKQISMMKRRPGLTMEEFVERYESVHAKFGETLFAGARRYVRRYVKPMRNPLTGEVRELDFDVIMEIWWDSLEDFERAVKDLASSELLPAIQESGKYLFASHDNPAFFVEEHDTDMGHPLPDSRGA